MTSAQKKQGTDAYANYKKVTILKEKIILLFDIPSPVSISSAFPYFGATRAVDPCGLSTCIECSEV